MWSLVCQKKFQIVIIKINSVRENKSIHTTFPSLFIRPHPPPPRLLSRILDTLSSVSEILTTPVYFDLSYFILSASVHFGGCLLKIEASSPISHYTAPAPVFL